MFHELNLILNCIDICPKIPMHADAQIPQHSTNKQLKICIQGQFNMN